MSAVCVSNRDIILTFTLTMHIQLQNNCTYGRYCDDKISDMYPNTYELQVIKKEKEKNKKRTTLKILTQKKKIYFSLRNQWCIAPKDLYVAVF